MVDGWSCEQKDFSQPGVFLLGKELHQIFPFAKLYTITGMDMAEDFTMGVWVEVVATVWVDTVGVEFTGTVGVGVVGMGWAITLTLYLLLVSTLVLLFFSFILGPGAFLVMGLLFWGGALVLGWSWVWDWGLGLGPSLPSNSR